MKKATAPTHEEWLNLWHAALALATCEAIPETIFDSDTRSRLTVFLCGEALDAGRRQREKKKCPKGRCALKSKPTDVIQ